ncbi:hypothetical protein L596_030080 [Steinernema carpocapsae]|uniref:Glycine N-acyltransferase-like protein n=1 Tax=Steinernema carpocapsae TaxID=34508 RepID=A0A4V6XVK7_STECR|nr:hypothetical protein L596_030080 [Steinernema carpocapsae]
MQVDLEMKALGTHPHITCNDPYTMFYMDKDQCDKLMKTDLKLPEGFTFADLEADRDAEMTTAQMPYAGNGDLEQARSRMRTMPSVGIKHDLTNQIISFEYCSGFGHITHQYTFPEFRGLGLGRLVELRLCQKVIQELGIAPVKQVSRCRPRVIAMSKGSPFWTAYKNAQGSDILGYFRAYRKHPQDVCNDRELRTTLS